MSLVLKSYIKHVLKESVQQEREKEIMWGSINKWVSFQKDFTDDEASLILQNLDQNYNLISFGKYCSDNGKKPKIYRGIAGIKREELENIIGEKITSNNFTKKLNTKAKNKEGRLFDSWTSKKSWAKKFALRRFNIETSETIYGDLTNKLKSLGNNEALIFLKTRDINKKIREKLGGEIWNVPSDRIESAKEEARLIINSELNKSFSTYDESSDYLIDISRNARHEVDEAIQESFGKDEIISDYFDVILEGTIGSDNNPPNLYVDESFLANGEKLRGTRAQGEVIVFGQVNITKVQCSYTTFGNRTMGIGVAY